MWKKKLFSLLSLLYPIVSALITVTGILCLLFFKRKSNGRAEEELENAGRDNEKAESGIERLEKLSGESESGLEKVAGRAGEAEKGLESASRLVGEAESGIERAEGDACIAEALIADCVRILEEAEKTGQN